MRCQPIRVLLIESDDADATRVARALGADATARFALERAGDVPAAHARLACEPFDAIVLAVHAESEAGLLHALRPELLEQPVVLLVDGPGVLGGAAERVSRGLLEGIAFSALPRAVEHAVERRRLEARLARARRTALHLARHDPLSDLPNRQVFDSRLRQLLALSRRSLRPLAVLFLDLDRFQRVNDTLGHGVGDRLLQSVARRIRATIRESDTAARRGGDEFTILLDGIRRGEDAARVADKLLAELARPHHVDGHELVIGASIGISLFPADGDDVDTLVRRADMALHGAKTRGGGVYQFFVPEMSRRALERLELEAGLRSALERDELELHYQPQVRLSDGRTGSVEALVRWRHPELGLIFPDDFIPLAEETGLIVPLGERVLEVACCELRSWRDAGVDGVSMSVNFSPRQLQARAPLQPVERALAKSGIAASLLDLELTESAVMKDPGFALDVLRRMRELGVSITIDDFGTGYSSLAHLKRFPIQRLKVDKAFVRSLLVDAKDAAITRTVIALAHSLGIAAVGEGVETEEQLEFLRAAGCDEVQGYLLGRPVPAADMRRRLIAGTEALSAR